MFMLMGGIAVLTPPPPDHTCDPYNIPAPNAASLNLLEAKVSLLSSAVSVDLCEELVASGLTHGTLAWPTGRKYKKYYYAIPLTGGLGPRSVSIIAGSLPTGFTATVSPEGLIISGRPVNDTDASFTVRVTDASGNLDIVASFAIDDATFDSIVAGDTPELWWKLNETSGTVAADSSGNGRNGVISNAHYVADGIDFYQLSTTVRLSSPPAAVGIGSDEQWAAEAIVTLTGATGTVEGNIVTMWNNETAGYHNFALQIRGGVYRGAYTAVSDAVTPTLFSPDPVVLNTTRHLLVSRDGDRFYMFLDGVMVDNQLLTGSELLPGRSPSVLTVSAGSFPSSYGLIGKIRNVVLYSHSLTEEDALQRAKALGFA
jgi:hypothetical protein